MIPFFCSNSPPTHQGKSSPAPRIHFLEGGHHSRMKDMTVGGPCHQTAGICDGLKLVRSNDVPAGFTNLKMVHSGKVVSPKNKIERPFLGSAPGCSDGRQVVYLSHYLIYKINNSLC